MRGGPRLSTPVFPDGANLSGILHLAVAAAQGAQWPAPKAPGVTSALGKPPAPSQGKEAGSRPNPHPPATLSAASQLCREMPHPGDREGSPGSHSSFFRRDRIPHARKVGAGGGHRQEVALHCKPGQAEGPRLQGVVVTGRRLESVRRGDGVSASGQCPKTSFYRGLTSLMRKGSPREGPGGTRHCTDQRGTTPFMNSGRSTKGCFGVKLRPEGNTGGLAHPRETCSSIQEEGPRAPSRGAIRNPPEQRRACGGAGLSGPGHHCLASWVHTA